MYDLPSASTAKTTAKEHIEKIHWAGETTTASSSLFNGLFTTFVIDLTLLCIREHFIRLRYLLETFAFIWIFVRTKMRIEEALVSLNDLIDIRFNFNKNQLHNPQCDGNWCANNYILHTYRYIYIMYKVKCTYWYWRASLRYAFFRSSGGAFGLTPKRS